MSSKRRLRRNGCVGKVFHRTLEEAIAHSRITRHGKPYKCKYCSGWHIGGGKRLVVARAFRKMEKSK